MLSWREGSKTKLEGHVSSWVKLNCEHEYLSTLKTFILSSSTIWILPLQAILSRNKPRDGWKVAEANFSGPISNHNKTRQSSSFPPSATRGYVGVYTEFFSNSKQIKVFIKMEIPGPFWRLCLQIKCGLFVPKSLRLCRITVLWTRMWATLLQIRDEANFTVINQV